MCCNDEIRRYWPSKKYHFFLSRRESIDRDNDSKECERAGYDVFQAVSENSSSLDKNIILFRINPIMFIGLSQRRSLACD